MDNSIDGITWQGLDCEHRFKSSPSFQSSWTTSPPAGRRLRCRRPNGCPDGGHAYAHPGLGGDGAGCCGRRAPHGNAHPNAASHAYSPAYGHINAQPGSLAERDGAASPPCRGANRDLRWRRHRSHFRHAGANRIRHHQLPRCRGFQSNQRCGKRLGDLPRHGSGHRPCAWTWRW